VHNVVSGNRDETRDGVEQSLPAVPCGQRQRHTVQISAVGGFGRIEISMCIEPDHAQIRLMDSGDAADTAIAVSGQNQWEFSGFKSNPDLSRQKAISVKGRFDRVHEVGFNLKTFHVDQVPLTTQNSGHTLIDKLQRALSEADASVA